MANRQAIAKDSAACHRRTGSAARRQARVMGIETEYGISALAAGLAGPWPAP